MGEQKNPYFREACKYSSTYVVTLQALANSNRLHVVSGDMMEIDSLNKSHLKSQKFLFCFLLLIQDLIELKTREMQNTLCVQIIEPLVQIISVQPAKGKYLIDLACQEEALKILKTITKRSHIFDDSALLDKIICRLKVEFLILKEDMTGLPNRWKADRPQNDMDFNASTL